ncbi:RipA family octameric membrane protein [Bradyrhizobium oligotrophicum]|uniref:RipA family octameric membrane protein n=1 Tax=Bradyrhizobium oligotrophicum TaxID=44255 RepID=UPI003EB8ED10
MSELRDRYFYTLGLDPDNQTSSFVATLNRAYSLRSFEIEHYWKRATYFWGFQIAIFAAFGLLWKAASNGGLSALTVAFADLGFLTSIAHTISARGSKFWQQNWEKHIDMLEDRIEGRLHKTVWLHNGRASFSVSRVNVALTDCFVVFWLLTAIMVTWKYVGAPFESLLRGMNVRYVFASVVSTLVFLGAWRILKQRASLRGTLPNHDGSHGAAWRASDSTQSSTVSSAVVFIRRYAPDEDQVASS